MDEKEIKVSIFYNKVKVLASGIDQNFDNDYEATDYINRELRKEESEKNTLLCRICDLDGFVRLMEIPMPYKEFVIRRKQWWLGKLIQTVFNDLTVHQREFIMTGIPPEVWNKLFNKGKKDEVRS